MKTKDWTFEDLPEVDAIDLSLEWDYYYDAGRYFGRPEDCYPAEEDSDVSLPDGWEQIVMDAYMAAARKAITQIAGEVQDMIDDNRPAEWADDDNRSAEEARADYLYECERERMAGL